MQVFLRGWLFLCVFPHILRIGDEIMTGTAVDSGFFGEMPYRYDRHLLPNPCLRLYWVNVSSYCRPGQSSIKPYTFSCSCLPFLICINLVGLLNVSFSSFNHNSYSTYTYSNDDAIIFIK